LAYVAKKAGVCRYIYASSCSVYGYTVNELYDETRPVSSLHPYGISKLQGEQAVMNLADEDFSVIALRKGTVSGYSPRMRFDLIVNTMFKCALQDGAITINNPTIWRPILAIEDAINAYVRAVEAHENISGIFNIASGNYTVGEVGDLVRQEIEEHLNTKVGLTIRHVQDVRNYKVSFEKANNVLSFHPQHDVQSIVGHLIKHKDKFSDWDNPAYYNLQTFRQLENGIHGPAFAKAVGVG
jgi:nucleoside-diphosphate-sugar epimerase